MDNGFDIQIRVINDRKRKKDVIMKCESNYISEALKKIDFKNFLDKIDANAYFIVAYNENVILGYAVLYANNLETKEAYITLLEVYRAYQGKHIGNGLIEKCERLAKEKKMTKIRLEVMKTNCNAIKFYEKNGFTKSSEKDNNNSNIYMIKDI